MIIAQKLSVLKNSLEQLGAMPYVKSSPLVLNAVNNLATQLESKELKLVVLGQFKRGKSTLINALIGQQLLPTAIIPLTSVATVLKYGKVLKTTVYFLDGTEKPTEVADISNYITEPKNPHNEKSVDKVEIQYPSAYLQKGILIIDTPGVGSVYKNNTETAYQIISEADAGIFVFSADPPISESELAFLVEIKDFLSKIFFVQNKADQVSPSEQEESLSFTRRIIEDRVSSKGLKFIPISARLGLEGKTENNPAKLKTSNLSALEENLNHFLETEKEAVFVASLLRKLTSLVDEVSGLLGLEQKALSMPLNILDEKISQFNAELENLLRDKDDKDLIYKGQTDRLIKQTLTDDLETLQQQELPKIIARFNEFFNTNSSLTGSAFDLKLAGFIETEIRNAFSVWRKAEEAKLLFIINEITGRFKNDTNEAVNKVVSLSSKIFDVDLKEFEAVAYLPESKDFHFYYDEFRLDNFLSIYPLIIKLSKLVSKKYTYNRYKDELVTQFDRHCGRSRYDFARRIEEYLSGYKGNVVEAQNNIISTIKEVMEKARDKRKQGTEVVSPKLTSIQNQMETITKVRVTLTSLQDTQQ